MGLADALLFVVSLPERAVRSLAAGVGGVSRLVTDTLLPKTLRDTTFYKYVLGNTQRFIIEGIGEVEGSYAAEAGGALPDNYVPRKIVGNVVDAAGMFAFHFSPLWFFALVGDAAGGSKVYLQRIVTELKKDGALPADASVTAAEDLLDALTAASARTAMPLDTPPLSRAELGKLKNEIADGYGAVYSRGAALLPTPADLWAQFMKLHEAEKIPLLQLSGAMALSGAKAVGKATGGLFWEKVVLSYGASLDEVRSRGFAAFFAEASAPYLQAVAKAFAPARKTFTERLLSGELWRRKSPTSEVRPPSETPTSGAKEGRPKSIAGENPSQTD